MKNLGIISLFSFFLFLGTLDSNAQVIQKTNATVMSGVGCDNWISVTPVNCPEKRYNLCGDNYGSGPLDQNEQFLSDVAYFSGIRCSGTSMIGF